MKTMVIKIMILASLFFLNSCEKTELTFTEGDIELEIETGENWLHDFPLFLGLSKKNPPQFVIWAEDTEGNYITTIFATYKIATEGWQANGGNRRKESLPHWCHKRGVVYDDGLMLPTKENPLADGITGATPKDDKTIVISPGNLEKPFVLKAEINHSLDFNDFYPREAKEGEANYSGGEMGSGQPAVIYAATIYPETRQAVLEFVGHSSPDGSDGWIYTGTEGLTSVMKILKRITVTVK